MSARQFSPASGHLDGDQGTGRLGGNQQRESVRPFGPGDLAQLRGVHDAGDLDRIDPARASAGLAAEVAAEVRPRSNSVGWVGRAGGGRSAGTGRPHNRA